eukprot:1097552-Rhodomonas_salina.1
MTSIDAGVADFTDLVITQAGSGWQLRYSITPSCEVDARASMPDGRCNETKLGEYLAAVDAEVVSTYHVTHNAAARLAMLSNPRNATIAGPIIGDRGPVSVQLVDAHDNLVTCAGNTPEETAFIRAGVSGCQGEAMVLLVSAVAGCRQLDACEASGALRSAARLSGRRNQT